LFVLDRDRATGICGEGASGEVDTLPFMSDGGLGQRI
jgi:hypothetical protein